MELGGAAVPRLGRLGAVDGLGDVANVLAAAAIAVTALTRLVLVAYLVDLLPGLALTTVAVAVGALLLLAVALAAALTGGAFGLLAGAVLVEPFVNGAVGEATTIAKLAFARLLEVEALPTRWLLDGIALRVFKLALISVPAFAVVSESPANLSHC